MCISRLVPKTCGREKVSTVSKLFKTKTAQLKFGEIQRILIICNIVYPVLSLRGGGRGFPPGYYEHGPWLLSKENKRKIEPKENNNCLIPRLLAVFTLQLEILVTTLFTPHTFFLKQIV